MDWTKTDRLVLEIFRAASAATVLDDTVVYTLPGSNTVSYPAVNLSTLSGTSWLVQHGMHKTATDLAAPIGDLALTASSAAPGAVVAYDSNGGRTSHWPGDTVIVDATGLYSTVAYEVKNAGLHVSTTIFSGDGTGNLTFDWPTGTRTGDFAFVTGWQWISPGYIPAPSAGWTANGSTSTLNLSVGYFWMDVPAGVGVPPNLHLPPRVIG